MKLFYFQGCNFGVILGTIKVVKGEGFPHYRNPFEKGDLLVKFDVIFPPQNFATSQQLKVSSVKYIHIFVLSNKLTIYLYYIEKL